MEFGSAHFITLLKIRKHHDVTISQLAKDTGFNIPKTTAIVNELLNNFKLIKVTGSGKPIGGRPPKIFSINPDLGKIIGVDIGGENLRVIITDFNANILISKKDKTILGSDYNKTFNIVFSLIEKMLLEIDTNIKNISGIGISISGFIQRETGVCINSPNIGWGNVNVKDIFEKKYNKTIIVDDSVRCETIAEKIFGAARDVQNFILVSIGIGIGAGIFIRDNIYRGETGLAGELGHIIVTESITPRLFYLF
ncbi:MAG: ROK family protein, partial [Actinobacteria bacterium]|nr:ROK family protein [Actinomycetota bacterium]